MTSRRTAYPFLLLDDSLIDAGPWRLQVDAPINLGSELAGWDYAVPLRLTRELRIEDTQLCFQALELTPEAELLDLVVTGSVAVGRQRTAWRQLLDRQSVAKAGPVVLEVSIELDSRELAGRLTVATEIVLARRVLNGGLLSPREAGSRLWADHHVIALEGHSSRFPMEELNFSAIAEFRDFASTPWLVDWEPSDFESDVTGAIRVLLNSKRRDVSSRLLEGDARTLSQLRTEIVRQVISALVRLDDFQASYDYLPEGSLGSIAKGWIELAFPGMGPSQVSQKILDTPGRFDSTIHSCFGLLEGDDV